MKDASKRRLIRFMNGFDRTSAKSLPAKGWNQKTITRDEPAWQEQANDELDRMSGQELRRELLRQILYTLPVALFLLAVIVFAVWIVIADKI